MIYPFVYAVGQLIKQGPINYLANTNNFMDYCHIIFGALNVYMQQFYGTMQIESKIVLMVVILVTMMKTFEAMRVFLSYSYIVTMIKSVIFDLRVFLTFYVIMVVSLSMLFDVIARNESDEYKRIGYVFGNIFATMRLSLGDFDFSLINDEPLTKTHILFWVMWIFVFLFSSLIFLNFVIAEVSNSFQTDKNTVSMQIMRERA